MNYKTIKERTQAKFFEKNSEFIAYLSPVKNNEEAVSFINEIRSMHRKATHNVYAYIIQEENNNGDNQLSQMKDSNSKNSPQISNIEFEEYPYIDLIAILQEIDIEEVNNE